MTERYDVAIVGYGPTGASLAARLGQEGLRVVVLERSLEPHSTPRACHLDAEIARIIQGLGAADALGGLLTRSAGMEYVDASGRRVFTFEDFEREPVLGWHEDHVFVQPDLEALLRRTAEAWPSVEVRLGAEVVGVEPDADGAAVLDLADGSQVRAAWAVACDGGSSEVRHALGIDLVDLAFDEDWLVLDVFLRRPVPLPTIIQQVCDPHRLATFVPSHGTHRRWEFRVTPGEQVDPWALLAPWGVGPADGDLVRAATYRFHAVVADRWRSGRVLLAGDAAHMMPPFMGQGMCSGVRDAANLAWRLAAVQRLGAPDTLLDAYEVERRPHVEACVALSIQAGRLLGEIADALEDGLPPTLPEPDVDDGERWSRLPPLRSGTFDGAPFPLDAPVGHQARQPWVLDPFGERVRLDDLCGAGWSLVGTVPVLAPDWVNVIDAGVLGDPDGSLARLLGPGSAVLIRPDRYVFGVAAMPADVPGLVTRAALALGLADPDRVT